MYIHFNYTEVELLSRHKMVFDGKVSFTNSDIILLLGDNGVGKTSFLSVLQSISDREERGHVFQINWPSIDSDSDSLTSCQVFQEPRENFICSSSADEIILPLLHSDAKAKDTINRIEELCESAGVDNQHLAEFFRRKIDTLSSGEQQKIAICAALAPQPALILWDEALARVDDESAMRIAHLVCSTHNGTLIAATHRPQRYISIFGKRITSLIILEKQRDNIIRIHQVPIGTNKWLDVLKILQQNINFVQRKLWTKYVQPVDTAVRLFSNGFHCFPSTGETLIEFANLDFFDIKGKIVSLRKGSVSYKVTFVVGRNGSGKTLFLKCLTGHVPLNPWFWPGKRLHAQADLPTNNLGSLTGSRREGLSAFLAGEPMRWITDDSVELELRRFHSGDSFRERANILQTLGIHLEQNPEHLSYGQQKVMCLISLPDILKLICLDEPFADLSINYISHVEDFIDRQIEQDKWKAVVLSHSSDVALGT